MNTTHYSPWAFMALAFLFHAVLLAQPCEAVNSDLGRGENNISAEEGSQDAKLNLFPLLGNAYDFPRSIRGELTQGAAITSAFEYRQTLGNCSSRSGGSPYPVAITKFIPTESASLTFILRDINSISVSLFEGAFDPAIDNCSQLVGSTFRQAQVDGNFNNSNFLQVSLAAGKTYYLVVLPGQSPTPTYPRSYNIFVGRNDSSRPLRVYDGSVVSAPDYAFTYLAISTDTAGGQQPRRLVGGASSSGDFRNIPSGDYEIFGLNYDTAIDTTTFVNAELDDLLVNENTGQSSCLQLSRNAAFLNVTSASVAPVDWLTFQANRSGQTVKLDWDVAAETENDYFRIERSGDGTDWADIGEVAGNGTTKDYAAFTFTDRSPAAGTNYYRLVQVDFDGTENLSVIVQTGSGNTEAAPMAVFPNPFSNDLTMTVTTDVAEALPRIYDIQGRDVTGSVTIQRNGRQADITTTELPAGVYLVRWAGEQARVVKY